MTTKNKDMVTIWEFWTKEEGVVAMSCDKGKKWIDIRNRFKEDGNKSRGKKP